jgi:exopolyphosphatase/guanosine-5'-triphosphate,3'-diphosphate pyrophosphatase
MKIAVIDLGTNTFKLLVASRSAEGTLVIHHKEEVPVNLGRGGIEKGVIAEDAFDRGLEALKRMHAEALALGAERVKGFGTSALRSSRNGGDFIRSARKEVGIDITIIPGEEEAGLVLDGVRQAVAFGSKPMLVMDIGGGSTEFILATDRSLMWKHSFELGTTRLFERFPAIDPMAMETQLRMAQHIDAQLEALWSVVDRHWPTTLIGSAGSFDSLATMIAARRGTTLAPDAATLQFSSTEFDAVKDDLFAMTRAKRLAVNGLPDFRVDTIIPALMLIERILLHGITELRWSRYSLKEGAAARMLG